MSQADLDRKIAEARAALEARLAAAQQEGRTALAGVLRRALQALEGAPQATEGGQP